MQLAALFLLVSAAFADTVENVNGKLTPGVREAAVYGAVNPIEVGTFDRKGVTWHIRCKQGARPNTASCVALGGGESAVISTLSVQNGGSDMPDGGKVGLMTVEMGGCHVIVHLDGLALVGDVAGKGGGQ